MDNDKISEYMDSSSFEDGPFRLFKSRLFMSFLCSEQDEKVFFHRQRCLCGCSQAYLGSLYSNIHSDKRSKLAENPDSKFRKIIVEDYRNHHKNKRIANEENQKRKQGVV